MSSSTNSKDSIIWPPAPVPVFRSVKGRILDVFLLAPPILIYVYAAYIGYNHGRVRDDMVDSLNQAAKYGPSIFPILFSVVTVRFVMKLVQWRMQRGDTVACLNVLIGSQSLVGSILQGSRFLRYPTWTWAIMMSLVLMWSLSPLGGQASLRLVSIGDNLVSASTSIQHMDFNSSTYTLESGDLGDYALSINSKFISSLSEPPVIKTAGADVWGNIKIPMVEAISGFSESSDGVWHMVDGNQTIYSSLVGLPLAGVPMEGSSTFSFETSYWMVDCPEVEEVDENVQVEEFLQIGPGNDTILYWGGINMTLSSDSTGVQRCYPSAYEPLPLRRFRYGGYPGFGTGDFVPRPKANIASCTIQTSYVEVSALCLGRSCAVQKVRRSIKPHQPVAFTTLDCVYGVYFANEFTKSVPTTYSHVMSANILLAYIWDPFSNMSAPTITTTPSLASLSPQVFSTRLGQLFNTYYIHSIGTDAVTLGMPDAFPSGTFSFSASEATNVQSQQVLVCSFPWLVVLVISATALLIAAVISLSLEFYLYIPDLEMNMSTFTRYTYFDNSGIGSSCNDKDRTAFFNSVRVRFGVIPTIQDGEIGALGIGNETHISPVQKVAEYF